MLNSGALRFSVGANGETAIDSPGTYRDGLWHHAVITQGIHGMRLYVDGALVASGDRSSSQEFPGFWRVGGDKVWTGSTSGYFAGQMDEVAVYLRALTAVDVVGHYTASGRTAPNLPPTAVFTAGASKLTVTVDASDSVDADGSITTYSWDFGDGSTASGVHAEPHLRRRGTYAVTLTVTDDDGANDTTSKQVTVSS